MSYTKRLSEYQWEKLYEYLAPFPRIHTKNEAKTRRFVEAVFWILRSGAPWRMLPREYGHWNVTYQRFADWAEQGIWYKMLYYFAQDPDMEYIMIDSTVLRAHACAAGALKKKYGNQSQQALGRSRGGFSTKIHALCDAGGRPLDFILSAGQAADCTYAIPLLEKMKKRVYTAFLADKGYDTNVIVDHVQASKAVVVIPPKSNRIIQRLYDKELYKERHKIECTFGFLKHYRRLFARFEKIASRFQAFLHFGAALQWLK
jgi:transposase